MVKVSVIVPVCNVENYIRAGLDSLLNQTLKDIEIICVDDCSKDSSVAILKEYMEKDTRVKCIFHSKNLSTSQSRKDGVAASTGKYVMFMDADDDFVPEACELAFKAIERYKTDMVQFDTQVVNCGGMTEQRIQSNQKALFPNLNKIEGKNLLSACWRENQFGFTLWNKIYNGELCRKAFAQIEDGSYPKAQDLYAFFLIAYYSKSYKGVKSRLYNYNFGRGVTGGDHITLNRYDTILTEKYVWEAVVRFIKARGEEQQYSDILDKIHRAFLHECVKRWEHNLRPEYMSDGFEHLVDMWGYENVISLLAETSWFQRVEVAEKILHTDYFEKRENPSKEIKTIAAYYRCINNGGAQRVVAMLCNIWANMKDSEGNYLYNVVLITDEPEEKTDYPLHERVQREFIYHYQSCQQDAYQNRLRDWHRIIDAHKVDVVISSMWISPCTFWDLISVKGHERAPKFVLHSHSFCAMLYGKTHGMALEVTKNYKLADGVVCLSECDERFAKAFSKHVTVIENPLDIQVKDDAKSSKEENSIVWVGRISQEKNPLDVIRMMEYVVQSVPDAKLYIVGKGKESIEEKMVELIQSLNLEDNVLMVGFTNHVERYYRKAKICISTSEYEGFPLTYCEAMAHGLPVVSYELPWLTIVRDGRGICPVEYGREDLLAKEVIRLLTDEERCAQVRTAGKQQVTEIMSLDLGAKWKLFFEEMNKQVETAQEDKPLEDIILQYITMYHSKGTEVVNLRKKEKMYKKKIKKLRNQNQAEKKTLLYRCANIIVRIRRKLKKIFVKEQ